VFEDISDMLAPVPLSHCIGILLAALYTKCLHAEAPQLCRAEFRQVDMVELV
jgi:hypothetical protein